MKQRQTFASLILLNILLLCFCAGFIADEKTATLKFTKDQYNGIEASLRDAANRLAQVQAALKLMVPNSEAMRTSIDTAIQEIALAHNFNAQIDSVFNPKK